MKKNVFSATLAAILALTLILPAFAEESGGIFSDVPQGVWYQADVEYLCSLGIVDGYPDGTFRPQGTVTGAEFLKMLVGASGVEAPESDGGEWAQPYLEYGEALGLIGQGQYADGQLISKIQVADVAARYFAGKEYPAEILRYAENIPDYEGIPVEMRQSALKMYHDGIIIGTERGYLPDANLTRAEAAAVVARIVDESRRADVGGPPVLPVDTMKAAKTSGQIITVTSQSLGDYKAQVNVYEQIDGVWVRKYRNLPAVVGSRGMMYGRKQNSYKSPAGNFGFVFAFGIQEDPGVNPGWEYRRVTGSSYWVLDSDSPLYNRWSEGKSGFSDSEHLIDFGYQYDHAMVIDFNYENPKKGDGGAIFMHVATKDGKGTAGCIGLSLYDLLGIMLWLDPQENPRIIICPEGDLGNF